MKKLLPVIAVIVAFAFFIGCANVQLSTVENVALKTAARAAGYQIVKQNPTLAALALPYAKGILATDDATKLSNVLWPAAIALMKEKAGGDPLLAASIADVLTLVNVDIDKPDIKLANIKTALAAFIEGIELATK